MLPARPSVFSSPWCSPPSTLLPPPVDSSCRCCCCFGCCVIRPRAARTEGLGPGTPLASACTPPSAHIQSSRTGDSSRSLGSAPTWLPAAPTVIGKEKAGGPEEGGREPGVDVQEGVGEPPRPSLGFVLGRLKSLLGLAVEGSSVLDRDTPPFWGTQGSYLIPGQGAPHLGVT